MPETTTVTLSPQVLSELEPVVAETRESVEAIVNEAIVEYLRLWKKRKRREQLAREYEALASLWQELSEDIASEKWLTPENEALVIFEKSLN
ncbi:MAG: hypothetical protein FJ030_15845 [Chloroflexi bacterium]|nr:hypothetical protein [Chloroflexota bacterium]